MFSKIAKNKEYLELCLKFASTQTKSTKTSDILLTLARLAQDSKAMASQMLDLPNTQLRDELMKSGTYESKIPKLKAILQENLHAITFYVSEYAKNEDIAERAMKFIAESFISNTLSTILVNFNGRAGAKFSLKAVLNGLLKQAYLNYTSPNAPETKRKQREQSMDEGAEMYGKQFVAETPVDPNQSDNSTTDQEIVNLKNIFAKILGDPNQDVLSYYIEQTLFPIFEQKKTAYDSAPEGPEKNAAGAEFDEFYETVVRYINKEFSTAKRDPKTNHAEPFSLHEIQEKVNATVQQIDLNQLAGHIMQSSFYEMPKRIRKYAEEHPEFVKQALIAVLKANLIFNTKQELGVSLPSAVGQYAQGGRRKLSIGSFIHHILAKQIKLAFTDKGEQEDYLHKALNLLKAEGSPEEGYTYGGQGTKGYHFVSNNFTSHGVPLTYSGLLHQYRDQLGDDVFAGLTPEQDQQLIGKVHGHLHNREQGHLPHTTRKDKYNYDVTELGKLGGNADQLVKKNIQQRLNAAKKIVRGDQPEHTFMEDTPDAQVVSNIVKALIKKYASIN